MMVDTANVGFFQRSKGTTGCGVRRSRTKKTTAITAATASSERTSNEVNSWSRVMESATRSGTRVAASANAPAKSISRHEALWTTIGRVMTQTATARTPTGTLT